MQTTPVHAPTHMRWEGQKGAGWGGREEERVKERDNLQVRHLLYSLNFKVKKWLYASVCMRYSMSGYICR